MKVDSTTDMLIAREIMNLSGVDRSNVLPYTKSIDAAYTILSRFQYQGWTCNIKSKINDGGELFYLVRIIKGNHSITRFAPTIPLAICSVAFCVLKSQYDGKKESEVSDNDSITIVEKNTPSTIEIDDSKIITIIKKSLSGLDSSYFDTDGIANNILNDLHGENFIFITRPE